jgi:hypothetical protein
MGLIGFVLVATQAAVPVQACILIGNDLLLGSVGVCLWDLVQALLWYDTPLASNKLFAQCPSIIIDGHNAYLLPVRDGELVRERGHKCPLDYGDGAGGRVGRCGAWSGWSRLNDDGPGQVGGGKRIRTKSIIGSRLLSNGSEGVWGGVAGCVGCGCHGRVRSKIVGITHGRWWVCRIALLLWNYWLGLHGWRG